MAEANDLTIRIKAIDEASPVIKDVAETMELLEVKYDWRPAIGAFLGSGVGVFLAALVVGLLR